MTPRILFPVATAFLAFSSSASAHPGHDHPVTPPDSPAHWFIEPSHLVGWAAFACVIAASYKARKLLAHRSATPVREKHPQ